MNIHDRQKHDQETADIFMSQTNNMTHIFYSLFRSLIETAKTDQAIKKMLEDLIAVTQNQETATAFLKRLQGIIDMHPEEAETMTINAFIDMHPEVFAHTAGIGTNAVKYYHMLVQNKTSNKLQKKITEKITNPTQLTIYGDGAIESRDFKLFIRGYRELENGVNQSAARLLDSLMITATQEGLKSTLIRLPLHEYMEMRNLRDEKETRAQVKRDINALERISFEYRGTGKQRGIWLKVSIAGGTVGQIKNGDIIFRFNQDWYDSFRASETGKYMYMYFPREALKTNIKHNPWTYWLARKISEHKRINLNKPNADTIRVATLIEACPNFPSYTEIMAGNRNVTQRIIEPFERDMDALTESLAWHYIDTAPVDYKEFMESTVKIYWKDYPEILKHSSGKKNKKKTTAGSAK